MDIHISDVWRYLTPPPGSDSLVWWGSVILIGFAVWEMLVGLRRVMVPTSKQHGIASILGGVNCVLMAVLYWTVGDPRQPWLGIALLIAMAVLICVIWHIDSQTERQMQVSKGELP